MSHHPFIFSPCTRTSFVCRQDCLSVTADRRQRKSCIVLKDTQFPTPYDHNTGMASANNTYTAGRT